jgi:hypothetical protein
MRVDGGSALGSPDSVADVGVLDAVKASSLVVWMHIGERQLARAAVSYRLRIVYVETLKDKYIGTVSHTS